MAFNLTRRRFLQSASLAAVSIPLSKVVSAETGFTPSPLEIGFDAARNETLKKASGDWIMWIDADELLRYPERIGKYLCNSPFQGYSVKQNHFSSEPLQILFYKSPSPKLHTLKASEMEIVGQPILRDAAVTHATGRQADRYAGKEIVVQLVARDRSLTVEWRASLRNDKKTHIRANGTEFALYRCIKMAGWSACININ